MFVNPVLQVVPFDNLTNAGAIRTQMDRIKTLGGSIGVQAWRSTLTEAEVTTFYGVALEKNFRVVAHIPETVLVWDGLKFQLGAVGTLLNLVKNHPLTSYFFPVDEPLMAGKPTRSMSRLRVLYAQLKAIAPHLPIVIQWSEEIMSGEQGLQADLKISDCVCDVWWIGGQYFRNFGDGNIFYEARLVENHRVSRTAIKAIDPAPIIWSTIQVRGNDPGGTYYMPSATELTRSRDIVLGRVVSGGVNLASIAPVKGLAWQMWYTPDQASYAAAEVLSKPEAAAQQAVYQATIPLTETAASAC